MSRGGALPVVALVATAVALLKRRAVPSSRAHRPARPPSGSAVCPATGLSNDQAAAIAENADSITARIDAKAARTRREARARAAAACLIVASVAYATSSPAASAVALAICCIASAAFIADAARASSARRAAHETVAKARAQAASVLAASAVESAPSSFEGKWMKDTAASDSMTPALDAVNLHGLVRRAVHLMRGIELKTSSPPGTFQFSVFSALPWFRVTERYVLGGPPVRHRRRDLRRGGATGSASLAPPAKNGGTGRVVVEVAWGPPYAGTERDTYEVNGDSLSVLSEMDVGGQRISYVARYKRKT